MRTPSLEMPRRKLSPLLRVFSADETIPPTPVSTPMNPPPKNAPTMLTSGTRSPTTIETTTTTSIVIAPAMVPHDSRIDNNSRGTGTATSGRSTAAAIEVRAEPGAGASLNDSASVRRLNSLATRSCPASRAEATSALNPAASARISFRSASASARRKKWSWIPDLLPPATSIVILAKPKMRPSNGCTTSTACKRSRRACFC